MAEIRCSICGEPFDPQTSASMPFCGRRCREIDTARWLGERYTLPIYRLEEDGESPDSEEESS
jgi:endogenous inhibitor of DNA gyrase (YacG/DUF329 family)